MTSFTWNRQTLLVTLALVFFVPSSATATTIGTGSVSTWKDGSTAAATLTIDDNFQSDHAWWLSTASTYDVKMTWFVISGNVGNNPISRNGNWSDFIALQAAGHDIQSHTVDHFPNFPSGGPLTLETNYTQVISDIETNVPGSDVLTLAYPFGLQAPNDKTLAGQNYIAARGVTGVLNTLNGVDYLNVNSLTTDFYGTHGGFPIPGIVPNTHFAYIPNLVTPGKAQYEGWLSVHSHELSNDKKTAITGLLDYLTATPGDFWVSTFTDVAQYAQERDAASLSTQVISADEIQFTLTDTLDDARFYQPLSVKVRVDNSWTDVVATQAGNSLPVTLIMDGGEQFALVNSVPDLGVVTLTLPGLAGDYNGDDIVDAADYTVWRDSFGQTGAGLPADGDGSGEIDAGDYTVWTNNFGSVASTSTTVPEPTTALLSGMLLSLVMGHGRRNRLV